MMKNGVKRFTTRITLVLTVLGLFGCEKEEPVKEPEKGNYKTTIRVSAAWLTEIQGDGFYIYPDTQNGKIAEATIYLFATETDFLLDENPVHTLISSHKGDTAVYDFKETFYWVRVKKGELNSLRQANTKFKKTELNGTSGGYYAYSLDVALTRTPTKLRITAIEQGNPVEGADVQLYFSESDFLNNVPASKNGNELITSYGIRHVEPVFEDRLKSFFAGKTNQDGEVYFDKLEPRQYWIKITKGGKSNSAGIIKTPGPLPENADITTTLTIGIN